MTQSNESARPFQRVGDIERESAVEQLRIAAGDGRLSLDELGQRIEAVTTAQTYADLDAVTYDLPDATRPTPIEPVRASMRLAVSRGHLERIGDWQVARHLDVELSSASAMLDLSTAALPPGGVEIEFRVVQSKILIAVPAGMHVDASELGLHRSKIIQRGRQNAGSGRGESLRLIGDLTHSRLRIK